MSDIVEQLVARDRARQGLPPRITNTEALDRVAALLAAGPKNANARRLSSVECSIPRERMARDALASRS